MDKTKIWSRFTANISLVIAFFLMGVFIGFVIRTNQIIRNQFLTTARAYFNNILLTRRWNANYGGVFVKKVKGVVSNPYLENPDIKTVDGEIYTKKNPALMTREISEYAEKSGLFKYHITSLCPLNPDNAPDDFEKKALVKFEKGVKEVALMVSHGESSVYRYMAPLYMEKGCLKCHGKQGYKVGDVRGGISVSFDVSKIKHQMVLYRLIFICISVSMLLVLLVVIFFLVSRLSSKLSEAYSMIEKMSVTDELMQIYNRRYFHTRLDEEIKRSERYNRDLSLVMMDIDHFKKVNDQYGHQAGDDILVGVASILKNNTRQVDVVARYGGEEIVVILPETDRNGGYVVAEKIRRLIESHPFDVYGGKRIWVTASFGVSSLDMIPGDAGDKAKLLVKLADEALYMAKEGGRNRVVLYGTSNH